MHAYALLLALAAALAAAPATAADASAPAVPRTIPLRDFFAHSDRAYFRISEDGKTLGFMQPGATASGERRLNVFVQPLDGSKLLGEPRKLTDETARDVSIYYWKGSGTILYEKDFGGD